MMWAAIRRVVNDNFSEPLNALINRLIGATNNTGGSASAGTAMAKLNNVQTRQTSLIGEVNATGGTATEGGANAKLNALLTRVGAENPTASDATTVMNFLRQINGRLDGTNLGFVSAVKSVQRGYQSFDGGNQANMPRVITIAAVNPAKCVVDFPEPSFFTGGWGSANHRNGYVSSLTATALTVSGHFQISGTMGFPWQIVEYY
jgi:hypothetical protein